VNGERLTGTAEWDGILKLYEVEKHVVYRLLPKVTERHIQHGGQNTMRVSLAAQIVNSNVAPSINTLVTVSKNNSTVAPAINTLVTVGKNNSTVAQAVSTLVTVGKNNSTVAPAISTLVTVGKNNSTVAPAISTLVAVGKNNSTVSLKDT
jgi:hypothetical protein